jgi:uncharacterized protein (DUF362 family)
MSEVVIRKGINPQEVTVKALEMINAVKSLQTDKPVLLKPNYINSRHPSTGITTDARVVEGIIKYLKNEGLDEIIVGEGCGHSDTFKAFQVAGIDLLKDKYRISLIDLNKDTLVEVFPTNPLALRKVKVAKTVLETNIISVPKLKLHGGASVTLGLKNMMGVMRPKGSMHNGRLSKNIADLASAVTPHLTVIDGIIAGEGHETSGNPVKMNLVIAGMDPVAVDAVGAAVMKVSPMKVKHLVHSMEKGLGTCDLSHIRIIGEALDTVSKKFRRSPIF